MLQNVKSHIPQRQRICKDNGKERTNSKQFYFLKNGIPIRVCQKFFPKNLSISNGPLNKAFVNKNEMSHLYQGDDKREKHVPANKLPQDEMQVIKNYIEFPFHRVSTTVENLHNESIWMLSYR